MKDSSDEIISRIKYRPYLDSLRSIAVLYVILFHLFPNLFKGGFIGVDIFFVISGFIVTKTFLNSNFTTLKDSILGFFLRRVKRILPALLFLFIIVSILSILIIPPEQNKEYIVSGAYSLFGISNIFFTRVASDYFNFASSMNPFTHTWSLGVEEQFYLFLPLLIIGIKYKIKLNIKLFSDKKSALNIIRSTIFYWPLVFFPFLILYFIGYAGIVNSFLFLILASIISVYIFILIFPKEIFLLSIRDSNFHNNYFYLLIIFTLCSVILSIYLSFFSTLNGYYSVLSRFWELSLGVTLSIGLRFYKTKFIFNPKINMNSILITFFLISFIFYLFLIDKNSNFPMPYAILPVFSTLIIIFLSEFSLKNQTFFFNKPNLISSFGRISYSTYLWHWPLLIFLQWFFIDKGYLLIFIYFSLLLCISFFSYYFVEQVYLQKYKFIFLNIHPKRLLVFTMFLGLLFSQSILSNNFLNSIFIFSSISDNLPENDLKNAKCHNLEWNKNNIENCLYNNKKFTDFPHIYLFGDSHALNHKPMLDSISKETKLNFSYMTGGPFLLGNISNELNFIKNNVSKNDVIILTINRTYFYNIGERKFIRDYINLDNDGALNKTVRFRNIAEQNLEILIKSISDRNAKLILIHDIPILGFKIVSTCIMQEILNGYSLCMIPKKLSKAHRKPMELLFSKVSEKYEHVFDWDPHDLFCNNETCSYKVLDKIHYFDDGHLTINGSLMLKPYFQNFLKKNNLFDVNKAN